MIYPTEMTLTTGTTVYAGDPDSDERIQSREVRVSVTFQIDEEEDIDLADLAFAKAAEVERARIAALERIGGLERIERNHRDPSEPAGDDTAFDPSAPGLEPPPDEEFVPAPFPQENKSSKQEPDFPRPTGASRYEGAEKLSEAEMDWVTRPQVLALGSHFRRLGLSPQDQTALLRDRFGKFRAERLTKDEASFLMRSLERGEIA